MIANVNRDPKKQPEGWDWADVFPEWKPPTQQTDEEMFETMMAWAQTRQVN